MHSIMTKAIETSWNHLKKILVCNQTESEMRMKRILEYAKLCEALNVVIEKIIPHGQKYWGSNLAVLKDQRPAVAKLTKAVNSEENSHRFQFLQVCWRYTEMIRDSNNKEMKKHINHNDVAAYFIYYLVYCAWNGLEDGHFLQLLLRLEASFCGFRKTLSIEDFINSLLKVYRNRKLILKRLTDPNLYKSNLSYFNWVSTLWTFIGSPNNVWKSMKYDMIVSLFLQ